MQRGGRETLLPTMRPEAPTGCGKEDPSHSSRSNRIADPDNILEDTSGGDDHRVRQDHIPPLLPCTMEPYHTHTPVLRIHNEPSESRAYRVDTGLEIMLHEGPDGTALEGGW